MRDIRIAVVGPLPPPFGGMARITEQLSELIANRGIAVEVIRTNRPYRPKMVGNLKGIRAVFRLFDYMLDIIRVTSRVDLIHLMANSGWSWHLFAAPVLWIAWLRGVSVVLHYHGGNAESFFSRSWLLVKPSLKRARVVIIPSGFLQEVFKKRNIKVKLIPNIVDIERFQPNHEKTCSRHPNIVTVRNLEKIYDIGNVIRAFQVVLSKYPRAKLTIAGSGPEEEDLRELSDRLGISESTFFCGKLNYNQIIDLYREADLMVNTSLVDNAPISILEAFASRVPVVTTDVGGIPFMVRHRVNGMLVKPKEPKATAQSILEVLENDRLKNRLIEGGEKEVLKHDQTRVTQQLLDLYQQVLSS